MKIAVNESSNIDVDAKRLSDAKVTIQSVLRGSFLNLCGCRTFCGSPYPESLNQSHSRRAIGSTGPAIRAVRQGMLPPVERLRFLLLARGFALGPFALVEQGRIAVGDEIREVQSSF